MEYLASTPATLDSLNHCNDLLTSLLDSHLPHIHSFRGKWSLIGAKLTDLRTRLHHLAGFQGSLSSDVFSSVSATLSDALSVSQRCRNPSPAEGKLKTQSDIDSVISRLDRDIRDCDILIRSGVLQDPAAFASGDDDPEAAVGFEIRSLLTRLQIGGASDQSKAGVMDSLLRLLHADEKTVLIAVEQGVVPVLARLLDSAPLEMKEKAVAAVARVSVVDTGKLMAEGLLLLNNVIRVMESGSGSAKERACIALQALSLSRENARAIGSRGGIASLLQICQAGTPCSQAVAAGVLYNLSQSEENKENFVEENAVFILIELSSSGTLLARQNAMRCLGNLVHKDDALKVLAAREGLIESLKGYLDSMPVGRSLEAAVELVRSLASHQPIGVELISEGFVDRLVPALSCGVLGVRIAAAGAVYGLGFSSRSRKEIGECGCIGLLARMLDGKAMEEREAAAKALSRLLLCDGNRRIFKKEEGGVASAVQLLDPCSGRDMEKRWAVSMLASLEAHSNKCRKQMVAAGACVHLQKLAELNVDGAKKLSENLGGRGKLWGVLKRGLSS